MELLAPYDPAPAAMARNDGLRSELLRALAAAAETAPAMSRDRLTEPGPYVGRMTEDEAAAFRELVGRRKKGGSNDG